MITKICPKCNKTSYVDISKDAYDKKGLLEYIRDKSIEEVV